MSFYFKLSQFIRRLMAGLTNHLSGTSDGDFGTVITVKREANELRARFPSHLADLASRFHVLQPKETTITSQQAGGHGSCCDVEEYKVHLSVRLGKEDAEATEKELTLSLCKWSIAHIYVSGDAGSETVSAFIRYGTESAEASVSEYADPRIEMLEASHGGVKKLLTSLLDELGCVNDVNEIEMFKLVMGDGLEAIMDIELQKGYPSLTKVIMEQLDFD
ncbi:hypothetical protein PILCRDRAFT_810973 [Piloderma croceum F 1598]|uniref:Uncharacterized protein n=1 Tax=Piloderma croceum (strain F 1598) TaxID=765440 RepID=A0A0C3G636_PILCF|nr:hypothetical protein PILCRDRAFT_810973 [Piloderma croceum F 1598]